jgi:hypothetical protein
MRGGVQPGDRLGLATRLLPKDRMKQASCGKQMGSRLAITRESLLEPFRPLTDEQLLGLFQSGVHSAQMPCTVQLFEPV